MGEFPERLRSCGSHAASSEYDSYITTDGLSRMRFGNMSEERSNRR